MSSPQLIGPTLPETGNDVVPYGSPEAQYSKVILENASSGEQRPVKAIVSEKLVASLVDLYGYGW